MDRLIASGFFFAAGGFIPNILRGQSSWGASVTFVLLLSVGCVLLLGAWRRSERLHKFNTICDEQADSPR